MFNLDFNGVFKNVLEIEIEKRSEEKKFISLFLKRDVPGRFGT